MGRRLSTAALAVVLFTIVLLMTAALAACRGSGGGQAATTATPSPVDSAPAVTTIPTSANSPPARRGASEALTVPEIVKDLRPSVVHVQTEGSLETFFGREIPAGGVGTGIIADEKGHIITNNHVVRLRGDPNGTIASQINVTLDDGRNVAARVVGTDPPTDLAVLKIDADNLKPARLGSASEIEVGEDVVAIGFPLDLRGGPTVTKGVVSAKDRYIDGDQYTIPSAIQTDAAINPGNSGGPLVNMRGEVIGINTAIVPGSQNIGFAISVDTVQMVTRDLIASGRVERGYLGVQIRNVTPALARASDLPVEQGVILVSVVPDSPAARAGLRRFDIIVRMGEREIRNDGDLFQMLAQHKAGDTLNVEYYRGRQSGQVQVTLGQQPS